MKKKLLSILLCLLIIIPPISLDAGGMDLINNAIHNKTTDTRGRDLINKALGKDSQDVKIIKTKKEVSELKKANKKPIQQKKAKEAKRKQHVVEVKSLRLSPIIDTHDFETKVRQTSKWIQAGMKVKIDMRFRGRLITRLEVGRKIMNDFIEAMDEVAIVEKKPSMEGNTMSTVLAPKKK